MTELFETKYKCFGCGACRGVCPAGAIRMERDREGFWYPVADPELCTGCGSCRAVCPGKEAPSGPEGQAYALRCRDRELLKKSASGGAFSLLAEQILQQGGLVCGAVFGEDFRVQHVLSREISPMRKSKYVQSDICKVYGPMEEALNQGKQVLFAGTPCQCDGIRRYFGGEQKNLILAALVCRGVQSPGLWEDYVNHLSRDGALEAYCFRDKRMKNDGHTVAWAAGGREQVCSMEKDPFSRLYLKCITLRPSCYRCPYTRWELPFDLTIGDFWGAEKSHPELADGMGTSLVICRTQKGQALLEGIGDQARILPLSREEADQIALREPAKETILRKLLMQDFARKDGNGRCDIPLILKKYGG